MTKFWVAVASREHVLRGVREGICQVCHGKQGPLNRMAIGDWIVYYSPSEVFMGNIPCRRFTAIGRVLSGNPYQYQISENFIPWRRKVQFFKAPEIAIEPLINELTFIIDKQRWGFPFRRGCFSVSYCDFTLIASKMDIRVDDEIYLF